MRTMSRAGAVTVSAVVALAAAWLASPAAQAVAVSADPISAPNTKP